jgi:hypothetical protein
MPQQADVGQAPERLSVQPPQANQVVSSNGEIVVTFDGPPSHFRLDDTVAPDSAEPRRRSGSPARNATAWVLGLAEGVLIVGGLAVLLSCRFVDDSLAATHRAYLGIGLIFAGALIAVPATALIGERAGHNRGRRAKGRHRRPRHSPRDR